jgi:CysZ protein
MDQLATGVRDVQRGFAVLRRHPRLWKWIIAPAAITAALLVGLVLGVLHIVHSVADWVSLHVPDSLAHIAGTLIDATVIAVLWTGAVLVFVPLAGMIAGPFNEMLSEHLEEELTGKPAPPFALGAFVHGLVTSIIHSVRRLLAMLAGIVVVFALGFVPVVGTIAAVIVAVWLAAHGTAYDCYDAVLARRSLGYRAKLGFLRDHRARTMGLGGAVAAMLLVPGLNLIALGLGAASATVASLSLDRPR